MSLVSNESFLQRFLLPFSSPDKAIQHYDRRHRNSAQFSSVSKKPETLSQEREVADRNL